MREAIRHALATLALRATRVLTDVPESFPFLELGNGVRTPLAILSHVADLMSSSSAVLEDRAAGGHAPPASWPAEVDRFYERLSHLDATVATGSGADEQLRRLLQGPIADAPTHVGQLALLRRVGGSPVQAVSYYRAEVEVGRVGRDQAPADR